MPRKRRRAFLEAAKAVAIETQVARATKPAGSIRVQNIAILGGAHDMHTAMVKWGLERLGIAELTVWSWYDYPSSLGSTINLPSKGDVNVSIGAGLPASFDTIWYRRPGSPAAHPDAHPADVKFVESEASDYVANALHFLGNDSTLWVNHPDARHTARNKAVQLAVAREIGFSIPDTIFSNCPEQIRQFFREHDGEIIYKPFRPAEWRISGDDSERIITLPTTVLSEKDIQDDFAISTCPGIYQRKIRAQYEVRATVIGPNIICCKILSQEHSNVIDWRHDLNRGRIAAEPYELPSNVFDMCQEFCRRMGLEFGCIDLIVDKNGDHIFIEVNESGQFLWKEQMLPDLPLLDSFCRFLARGEGQREHRLRLTDYLASDQRSVDRQSLEDEYSTNNKLLAEWRLYRE